METRSGLKARTSRPDLGLNFEAGLAKSQLASAHKGWDLSPTMVLRAGLKQEH